MGSPGEPVRDIQQASRPRFMDFILLGKLEREVYQLFLSPINDAEVGAVADLPDFVANPAREQRGFE